MKIYVNWEWQEIVKTEEEAKDYLIDNGVCFDFNGYLNNELDFTYGDIFNLTEDEKYCILKQYKNYIDEAIKNYWEVMEL